MTQEQKEQVSILRERKTELQEEVNNITNEINNIILDGFNINKYLNQYIKIDDKYMYVKDIVRAYNGFNFIGNFFYNTDNIYCFDSNCTYMNRMKTFGENALTGDSKIEIISKDEYYKELDNIINNVKEKF